MKSIFIKLLFFASVIGLSSCEDVIDIDIQDEGEQLVIDAWITNKDEDQVVKLSLSQPYFDNSTPQAVTDATVILFDEDSVAYPFIDLNQTGEYTLPREANGFLKENKRYALYIKYKDQEFAALSLYRPVPKIDSIAYEFFEFPFAGQDSTETSGYFAEFYANDPVGEGDTYWIRTTKNANPINDPASISISYDGGFSPGGGTDGLTFILPIRQSINDGFYQHGDSLDVELWSITPDAYLYLLQVRQESANGGIFATPPANIPTNIFNLDSRSDVKALGFFGISQVSSLSAKIDSTKARPSE